MLHSDIITMIAVVLDIIIATPIVPCEPLSMPLPWWSTKLPFLEPDGLSEGWLDTYQVQIVPFIANAFSIFLLHQ